MTIKVTASMVKDRFTVEQGRPSGAGYYPYESLTPASTLSAQTNNVPNATPQNQVTYLPGTFQFSDFADATDSTNAFGYGAYFQPQVGGVWGSGIDQTIFQMVPNTSTQAAYVPLQATGKTNNYSLMRAGGGSSIVRATKFGQFTVRGTAQGMLYNGLTVYYVTGGIMQDVKIIGIPGNASSQPGETFGINDYHTSGMTYRRVEIDGRDYSTGTVVGASGFGGNLGSNLLVDSCYSHHSGYSAGFTCNTYTNITYTNCIATDTNKMSYNFERVGGTVTMNNCTSLRAGTVHINIASDQTNAVYNINNPVFDGSVLQVKVTGFGGGTRTQDPNNINFLINGVSFSGTSRPDLANVVVTS